LGVSENYPCHADRSYESGDQYEREQDDQNIRYDRWHARHISPFRTVLMKVMQQSLFPAYLFGIFYPVMINHSGSDQI
jgi:hypothetical protein